MAGDGRPADVEIHVCTLNEEEFLGETLASLRSQRRVLNGTARIVVVDSYSTDATPRIARQKADALWQVPRGKLTARQRAMERTDADIVAVADAGDVYPPGWLDSLLRPFADDNVVATYGRNSPRAKRFLPAYLASSVALMPRLLPGNNSAVERDAFFEAGGFRTGVDETDLSSVWREEEFALKRGLEDVGEVVYLPNVVCRKSTRRYAFSPETTESYASEQKGGVRF